MRELKDQFIGALLVIITAAAAIAAALNFQQQNKFHLADDGVTWMDRAQKDGSTKVEALYIAPGAPAEKAGVRAGDILISISEYKVVDSADVTKVLTSRKIAKRASSVGMK